MRPGRKRIDSFVQSELNKAALAVHDQRRQSELQHLQFVMGLAAGVNQSALSVFSAAVGFYFKDFKVLCNMVNLVSNLLSPCIKRCKEIMTGI